MVAIDLSRAKDLNQNGLEDVDIKINVRVCRRAKLIEY